MENALGGLLAHFGEVKKVVDSLEKQLKQEQALLDAAERDVIDFLVERSLTSAECPTGKVTIRVDRFPQIKDRAALFQHIREKGEPELLQSRLTKAVVNEWVDAHEGALPPGVEWFEKPKAVIKLT